MSVCRARPTDKSRHGMRRFVPPLVDVVLILAFAVIGRRSHDEGTAVVGTVTVAVPFLIGYAIAAAVGRLDRAPLSARRAALVVVVGVSLGLVLRGTVFDRGLAPAFVVVAFVTITALLVGWRLVLVRIASPDARS